MRQISTLTRTPTQNTFNFTCNYTATLNFSDDKSGKRENPVPIFG